MEYLALAVVLCTLFASTKQQPSRIIGGTDARKGAFPWMAELVYIESETGEIRHWCGGSLVGDGSWVLTASHCIGWTPWMQRAVVLGEYDRSEQDGDEQLFFIHSFVAHPVWDIALIRLASTPILNSYVRPIEISDERIALGNPITVSGWGWTLHMQWNSTPDVLQQIQIPVAEPENCNVWFEDNYPPYNEVSTYEFCAGYNAESYIGPCHGDSGSPAVFRRTWRDPWKQYGVVNWGAGGCPEDSHYGVFADLSYSYDWIQYYLNCGSSEGSEKVVV